MVFPDVGGDYGSALQGACVCGQLDIVNTLLENKADPNLQGKAIPSWTTSCLMYSSDGYYGSALQAACAKGEFNIVNTLLENKADPNLQGKLIISWTKLCLTSSVRWGVWISTSGSLYLG